MINVFIVFIYDTFLIENRIEKEHLYGIKLLVYAVKKVYGKKIHERNIKKTITGKPFLDIGLAEYEKIFFNISHSGNYVMCAVSDGEVGCDIQQIRTVPKNLHRYLKKIKDVYDFNKIKEYNKEEQTLLWTVYESLGKYLGIGIPFDIDVTYSKAYKFYTLNEYSGYIATVCSREDKIKWNEVDFRRLL